MSVNPKPDHKFGERVISTVPVVVLAVMAIGAVVWPVFMMTLLAIS